MAGDLTGPLIAFESTGGAAVAYDQYDEDNPLASSVYVIPAAAHGFGSRRRLASTQQILGLAFDGPDLDLLAGISAKGFGCCATAEPFDLAPHGSLLGGRAIVRDLAGPASGALLSLPHGLAAVVATNLGVWVSRAANASGFGAPAQLSVPGWSPQQLATTMLGGGGTAVAWAASGDSAPTGAPTRIYLATGTARSAPRGHRAILTLSPGYSVDELAVAARGERPTVAWTRSWLDAQGVYHSLLYAEDVGRGSGVVVSPTSGLATSVSIASDPRGDQVIAWRQCDRAGLCAADAALRRAGGRWGPAHTLGLLDPTETPVAAESSSGTALVGWIAGGHVLAAATAPRGLGFKRVQVVSGTSAAANLALAFGPGGQALAAWTQGSIGESVMVARFTQ